jgi:hypothetical protein
MEKAAPCSRTWSESPVTGPTDEKNIMYYYLNDDLNAMARLVEKMHHLAINKLILVVDDTDITPAAKNCLSALKPRYYVKVVAASDLCDDRVLDHFCAVAKDIAKDGMVNAKEFYIRAMKGQKNRELANSLIRAFVAVNFTISENNNEIVMKFKPHDGT